MKDQIRVTQHIDGLPQPGWLRKPEGPKQLLAACVRPAVELSDLLARAKLTRTTLLVEGPDGVVEIQVSKHTSNTKKATSGTFSLTKTGRYESV